jgi:hypothetical protein
VAKSELKDFEKRWDVFIGTEKLEMLNHFEGIFKKYIKQTKDEEMKQLYKEAIEWCSKKRLQLIKELI